MNSEESPCGENLEYSLAFLQLERSAAGRPEQQYGQTIIAAEEPNWNEVQTIASELLTNTKDLRIAIEMANAELAINGIQGFEAALQMICGYIENFWDDVHPQPHPDDHDDDPDPRANALMSLCSPESTLRLLRRFPIIDSQMMGRYTVTDLIKAGLGSEHAETKQPYSAEIQTAISTNYSATMPQRSHRFKSQRKSQNASMRTWNHSLRPIWIHSILCWLTSTACTTRFSSDVDPDSARRIRNRTYFQVLAQNLTQDSTPISLSNKWT